MFMKIGVIGTSRITEDHLKILKNFKYEVVFLSSTRKNSLNLTKLAKKYKIKKFFNNWKAAVEYAGKIKGCNFLVTSRIKDNKKILKECVKLNRYVLIEKPVFLKEREFKSIKNFKKIFVGYNRIFYDNIIKLKNIFNKKKSVNVLAKCPEVNKLEIVKNSCHIISILIYIFGPLRLIFKKKNLNFINCTFLDRKKNVINLFFNFKSSDNFSIEFLNKKTRYVLSPIETLKIFKKVEIKKINNNYTYLPKCSYVNNEWNTNKFKPGFKNQYKEFKKFTQGKKIINNMFFSRKIIKICEQIIK